MDMYMKHNYNSLPEHNNRYRYMTDHHNPSFSSTLLDQIYRSIDESNDHKGTVMPLKKKKKKQYIHTTSEFEVEDEVDLQRIENWMDRRKASENITKTSNERSAAARKINEKYGSFVNLNSSWSSSDSSTGGLFSSEAEASSRSSSTTTTYRPKPVKTSSTDFKKILRDEEQDHHNSGGVVKRSKLKALKIYGDLKKAKQPISPGAKLASFLNSLFTTGGGNNNAKKGKTSSGVTDSLDTSPACSTSRSCLSKSPGKSSSNGTKRSVRFYPVSVIVDEHCQPCGHKSLQRGHGLKNVTFSDRENCMNEELLCHLRRKDQSVEEAARELLKNYQRKVECQMELEDDDDDGASYASSDLFELDNLDYMEELPVYETTYLETNRAIANSSLVM